MKSNKFQNLFEKKIESSSDSLKILKLNNKKNNTLLSEQEIYRTEKTLISSKMSLVKNLVSECGVNRIFVQVFDSNEGNLTICDCKGIDIETARQSTKILDLTRNDIFITVNPEFTAELNSSDLRIVVEHELWHIAIDKYYPNIRRNIAHLQFQAAFVNNNLNNILPSIEHLYLRDSFLNKNNHKDYLNEELELQKRTQIGKIKEVAKSQNLSKLTLVTLYIGKLLELGYINKLSNDTIEFERNKSWIREQISAIIPNSMNETVIFKLGDIYSKRIYEELTFNGKLMDIDVINKLSPILLELINN